MSKSDELNFALKRFIVQRLACYDTPSQVVAAVKADFAVELTRQRVHYYDPTKKLGAALDPTLKAFFDDTRKAFLADLDNIPIANKAVRLRHLQRQVEFFADKNAAMIVMALCEAAAKERGGAFTNEHKHKHMGPNGEPLPPPPAVVTICLPDNGRGDTDHSERNNATRPN